MNFVMKISVIGFGFLYVFFSLALKTWDMVKYPENSVLAFAMTQAGIILMSAVINYLIIEPEKSLREETRRIRKERDEILRKMGY